ncbi:MAG: VTC domain-containing protein [Pelagibacterales bacterium]|nr:VTC domain-containing protein [Pelagibacterales bacterium]
MNKEFINPNRFEKKWLFKNTFYPEVLLSLYRSKFFFRQQHTPRFINSIYFDTNNLDCINDNLDGTNIRKKFRVRWYGNNKSLNNPNLEIKYKKNFESYKKIYLMEKFKNLDFTDVNNIKLLSKYINNNILLNQNLKPINLIQYKRLYLISSNNLIRATLDYDIKSKKIINFLNPFFSNFRDVILELKYETNLDNYVRTNLNQMNTRYSKSSKYINYTLFPSNNFS